MFRCTGLALAIAACCALGACGGDENAEGGGAAEYQNAPAGGDATGGVTGGTTGTTGGIPTDTGAVGGPTGGASGGGLGSTPTGAPGTTTTSM